jgi:magnesium chelatase family protein
VQTERFKRMKIHCNAQMASRHIKKHCAIGDDSHALLEKAIDKFGLSARAFNRILKIARTIADLAGSEAIDVTHISEAIQYRNLDRKSLFG